MKTRLWFTQSIFAVLTALLSIPALPAFAQTAAGGSTAGGTQGGTTPGTFPPGSYGSPLGITTPSPGVVGPGSGPESQTGIPGQQPGISAPPGSPPTSPLGTSPTSPNDVGGGTANRGMGSAGSTQGNAPGNSPGNTPGNTTLDTTQSSGSSMNSGTMGGTDTTGGK